MEDQVLVMEDQVLAMEVLEDLLEAQQDLMVELELVELMGKKFALKYFRKFIINLNLFSGTYGGGNGGYAPNYASAGGSVGPGYQQQHASIYPANPVRSQSLMMNFNLLSFDSLTG